MLKRLFLTLTIASAFLPMIAGVPVRAQSGMLRAPNALNADGLPGGLPARWARYKANSYSGADGDRPSQWNDLTGNARHATQATAGTRPTFRSNCAGLTGNTKCFDFTPGSSNWLIPAMAGLNSSAVETFFVVKADLDNHAYINSGTSGSGLHSLCFTTADTVRFPGTGGYTNGILECYGSNAGWGVTPFSGPHDVWHTYSVFSDGAQHGAARNGVETASASLQFSYCTNCYIGRGPAASFNYFNGRIAEVIIFTARLNAAQRTKMQTYVASEYGL